MEDYFTDEIVKVTVITDEWGSKTETDSDPISCRIKDNNKLIIDAKGQEVLGEMLIDCGIENNFKYEDKVKIKKRWGVAFSMPDKQFIVKKIRPGGGFENEYIGIYI